MAVDKIDRIKKISQKLKPEVQEPNKDYFESLMRQRKVQVEDPNALASQQKDLAKKTENTIFDEVRELNKKVEHATRSSPNELASQADDAIAQIDILKDKLETPNLEIKGPVQTLLRNKLNHIDENLKIALDKAGLDYVPPEKPTSLAKPVERFLGLLTHSQSQLETLAEDVRTMSVMDKELSPASMLLIQIKVSYIQQEIELFTSMLNKALESTKTIMNVQV
jgi:hypothetical protein